MARVRAWVIVLLSAALCISSGVTYARDTTDTAVTGRRFSVELRPTWNMPSNGFYNGHNSTGKVIACCSSFHLKYGFTLSPESRDGKLFPGCNGFGGEFGHIPLVHGGVECNCGKHGCFEVYGSANALKRETREMAEQHPESVIWEMCEGDLDNIGGRTAFDAADKGDETGKAIVEQYISYLADGISGIVNVFRPEVVVLGGGVSNQGASLLDPLNEKVAKLCYANETIEAPKVIKASLGNSAGIIGAGMLGF